MHRLLKTVLRETLPAASSCFPSAAFMRLCMHLTVAYWCHWDFTEDREKISLRVGCQFS